MRETAPGSMTDSTEPLRNRNLSRAHLCRFSLVLELPIPNKLRVFCQIREAVRHGAGTSEGEGRSRCPVRNCRKSDAAGQVLPKKNFRPHEIARANPLYWIGSAVLPDRASL